MHAERVVVVRAEMIAIEDRCNFVGGPCPTLTPGRSFRLPNPM
jgi:hypothetical protein